MSEIVYQINPAQQQMIEEVKQELEKEAKEKFDALQTTLISLHEEYSKPTDPTTFAKKYAKIIDKLVCAVSNYKFPKVNVELNGNVGVGLFGNTSVGKSIMLKMWQEIRSSWSCRN